MTLKDQIYADMIAAMKARAPELGTLRMLKADIMKYEVSGADKVATDEVVQDLLKRAIKQRKEASEGFAKGGNMASSQQELDEMKMIEKYLPEQMAPEELKKIVQETIAQMNATPAEPGSAAGPSFGAVMGAVMGKVKGKADGNAVSAAVKALLS